MAKPRRPRSVVDPMDYGMLPNLIGYRVRLAQIAIFRDFAASMDAGGITPTQFGTLVLVEANPGVRQTELARALLLDRSTVVPLLGKLERMGLVAREKMRQDNRSKSLFLTAKGTRLLQNLKPRVLAHEQRLSEALSVHDRVSLVRSLALIFPDKQNTSKTI